MLCRHPNHYAECTMCNKYFSRYPGHTSGYANRKKNSADCQLMTAGPLIPLRKHLYTYQADLLLLKLAGKFIDSLLQGAAFSLLHEI